MTSRETTIQLHYSPGTAAMAPHILLEELGVPYEKLLVDTAQACTVQRLTAG